MLDNATHNHALPALRPPAPTEQTEAVLIHCRGCQFVQEVQGVRALDGTFTAPPGDATRCKSCRYAHGAGIPLDLFYDVFGDEEPTAPAVIERDRAIKVAETAWHEEEERERYADEWHDHEARGAFYE